MSGGALGFLQLCADRRFHRAVMGAFERETDLRLDEYWIEARAGGAPSWAENTKTSRLAHRGGARFMGWAAHGAECLGFPGESDDELRARLERVAARRAEEFPRAVHVVLFALPDRVEVTRIGRS
jgi:broad specificity phosphatase PhoE